MPVAALPDVVDVVVVGAGIVGLAHAIEAHRTGRRVAVIERDGRAVGASVRNFGHAGVTPQSGIALDRAERARRRWLELAGPAGFWAEETGTLVVARADDEQAVLHEFAELRGDAVEVLDAAGVRAHLAPVADDVVGGAFLPRDVRVDPRRAVGALAAWFEAQAGASIHPATTCARITDAGVLTSRGEIRADRVVVCVNYDVDHLFPEIAASAAIRRCWLQMLRVAPPSGMQVRPAVLTGSSLLRYSGFAACPSLVDVRRRFELDHADLLEADVNLMFTQLPDGTVVLGDTHRRDTTVEPFSSAAWDDLLLREGARLLGVDGLSVLERWQGVYATAPDEFLVVSPIPTARVVSVTTGIGMTTAFGLAEDVIATL